MPCFMKSYKFFEILRSGFTFVPCCDKIKKTKNRL